MVNHDLSGEHSWVSVPERLDSTDFVATEIVTVNDLVVESYNCAKEKGWHDPTKSFGEEIALCHAELSEAIEEYRNGYAPDLMYYSAYGDKPEGVPVELADVIIRIFDMCGKYGIDIEAAIITKQEFNRTRPERHGGKVL